MCRAKCLGIFVPCDTENSHCTAYLTRIKYLSHDNRITLSKTFLACLLVWISSNLGYLFLGKSQCTDFSILNSDHLFWLDMTMGNLHVATGFSCCLSRTCQMALPLYILFFLPGFLWIYISNPRMHCPGIKNFQLTIVYYIH